MTNNTDNLYDILQARGFVAQCTDADDAIRKRLSLPIAAYCGFDPTADSLHVGSLVPIMALAHLQRCGHRPIVLVGGATGRVGDPSGKTESRKMLSEAEIDHNARSIAKQIGRVVRFDETDDTNDKANVTNQTATGAVLVNNLDWIGPLTWLEVLRDIGSRVSVNRMVTMDYVARRLSGEDGADGISYLEFSYMLLQAYDFVHLHREHGCTLQMAGQDQWGNIVMGIEMGRKLDDADLAGLTSPLITKSDGGKFGKSEKGNIWLDATRTSPYEFYQFWRNVADNDVAKFMKLFTFIEVDEIKTLTGEDTDGGIQSMEVSAINAAKERLAFEVTKLIHGEAEAQAALDSAQKAFSTTAADVTGDAIPHTTLPPEALNDCTVLTLLTHPDAGLAKSNGEARRLVTGGGVKLHDEKITDFNRPVTMDDVKDGFVLLRVGKKRMFRFDL